MKSKNVFLFATILCLLLSCNPQHQPPEVDNSKYIPISELANYKANIEDAKAVAILNISNEKGIENISHNRMVKATTSEISENQIIDEKSISMVTFTKIKDTNTPTDSITQDDFAEEIDKLCVQGDYTFISFVPRGQSHRPSANNISYDYDKIAFYDKSNYFTDTNRKSFVIHNKSGYIYNIEGLNIKELRDGLILSDKNNIYDYHINDNSELVFDVILSNPLIKVEDYFKDKYGNIYIKNNKLSKDFGSDHIMFYKDDPNFELFKTIEGEVLRLDSDTFGLDEANSKWSVINENHHLRPITSKDSYHIHRKIDSKETWYSIQNDIALGYSNYFYQSPWITNEINFFKHDIKAAKCRCINSIKFMNGLRINMNYFDEFDEILIYYQDNILALHNAKDFLYNLEFPTSWDPSKQIDQILNASELILDNCKINDEGTAVIKYEALGNTVYDIVCQKDSLGKTCIKYYEHGKYIEDSSRFIFQPINRI